MREVEESEECKNLPKSPGTETRPGGKLTTKSGKGKGNPCYRGGDNERFTDNPRQGKISQGRALLSPAICEKEWEKPDRHQGQNVKGEPDNQSPRG